MERSEARAPARPSLYAQVMSLPGAKIVIGVAVVVVLLIVVDTVRRMNQTSPLAEVAKPQASSAPPAAAKSKPDDNSGPRKIAPGRETKKKSPAELVLVPAGPSPQSASPVPSQREADVVPKAPVSPPPAVPLEKPGKPDVPTAIAAPPATPAGTVAKPGAPAASKPAAAAAPTLTARPPANESEAAVADLASGSDTIITKRLKLLEATFPIAPDRQVAQALESVLLEDAAISHRMSAARALVNWSTEESVPVLLRMVKAERSPLVLRPLIEAVMKYKPEEAIEPIARQLSNMSVRRDAGQALKSYGPIAEEAVVAQLAIGDSFSRIEVCEVLQVIGTKKSIPPLQLAVKDRDIFVSRAAVAALHGIRAAQRVAPKPTKTAGSAESSKKALPRTRPARRPKRAKEPTRRRARTMDLDRWVSHRS